MLQCGKKGGILHYFTGCKILATTIQTLLTKLFEKGISVNIGSLFHLNSFRSATTKMTKIRNNCQKSQLQIDSVNASLSYLDYDFIFICCELISTSAILKDERRKACSLQLAACSLQPPPPPPQKPQLLSSLASLVRFMQNMFKFFQLIFSFPGLISDQDR